MLPGLEITKPRTEAQTLRPYQEDALRAIVQAWEEHEAPLIVMATGLGKTTVAEALKVFRGETTLQSQLKINNQDCKNVSPKSEDS